MYTSSIETTHYLLCCRSHILDVGNNKRIVEHISGPALQAQTKSIVVSLQCNSHSLRVGHQMAGTGSRRRQRHYNEEKKEYWFVRTELNVQCITASV